MHSSPTLEIQHRPDLNVLTVRWLGPLLPEQFRRDYQAVLDAGQAQPTPRWLIDVRRRPEPTPEQAEWASTVWLPQVVALLAPHRPRLAYLISPSREQALRTNAALKATLQTATRLDRGYDVAIFNNEGEATHWLLAANSPA